MNYSKLEYLYLSGNYENCVKEYNVFMTADKYKNLITKYLKEIDLMEQYSSFNQRYLINNLYYYLMTNIIKKDIKVNTLYLLNKKRYEGIMYPSDRLINEKVNIPDIYQKRIHKVLLKAGKINPVEYVKRAIMLTMDMYKLSIFPNDNDIIVFAFLNLLLKEANIPLAYFSLNDLKRYKYYFDESKYEYMFTLCFEKISQMMYKTDIGLNINNK